MLNVYNENIIHAYLRIYIYSIYKNKNLFYLFIFNFVRLVLNIMQS